MEGDNLIGIIAECAKLGFTATKKKKKKKKNTKKESKRIGSGVSLGYHY